MFSGIKKEHILQSLSRIDEEGYPPIRKSSSYDLVYNRTTYPPKYVISLAGYFAKNRFIKHKEFKGGEKSAAFAFLRSLDFIILPKAESQDLQGPKEVKNIHQKYLLENGDDEHLLNEDKFRELFVEYYNYCQRSVWLSYRENYKFKFGRWLSERVDFDSQTDQEILEICIESQDQQYYEEGNEKGVNFIISALQYHDDFITLKDVQTLRKLHQGLEIEESDLSSSSMTFPKFSCWAGTLIPEDYKIFANEELTGGIAHLFDLEKYPKSGVKGFTLANECLLEISSKIDEEFTEEQRELTSIALNTQTDILDTDKSWLTQDFILYLNRMKLNFQPNYYWVNQGDNYKRELEDGSIWAPDDNVHHHKRMKDLKEGDILIHYAKGIQATSKVKKEFTPLNNDQGTRGLIVEVEYKPLDEVINIEEVANRIMGHETYLPKKYSPLNKKLEVNEGYIFDFGHEAFNIILNHIGYWVFQGNPQKYDFKTGLKEGSLEDWTVAAHKEEIKTGDQVILWLSGPDSGCYGLARVTSNPYKKKQSKDDHLWVEENKNDLKVDIEITHNLLNAPISKAEINKTEALSELKVGIQGTNFTATKEQFEILLEMANDILKNKGGDSQMPLNTILYGPPGTGKTYSTVDKAVQIIAPKEYNPDSHDDNKKIYHKLKASGNVVFTTFHQSYSYEDFIEGIKPQLEKESEEDSSEDLQYQIVDGVFKELCLTASEQIEFKEKGESGVKLDKKFFEKGNWVFKVSLGDTSITEDNSIYEYCIENSCIAIGWGEDIDFSNVKSRKDIRQRYQEHGIEISSSMDFNISAIERLVLWMKKGHLVFISNGNRKLRAIAQVSGEYYTDTNAPIGYSQFRKVKWLYKDLEIPVKEFYPRFFSQQAIYGMYIDQIDQTFFEGKKSNTRSEYKNYVLIIDEINRGNISQIFGELITLIEDDKRKDGNEHLSALLPYSKKPFEVPSNVYLIGTMNTADRSVEALDTALRRRFHFEHMAPNPDLLKDIDIEGINLKELLEVINERVSFLKDEDHQIGHSYFLNVKTKQNLANAFGSSIIPLLKEYFYNDFGKIRLVLGDGFVSTNENGKPNFAIKDDEEFEGITYQIKEINSSSIIAALNQTLGN